MISFSVLTSGSNIMRSIHCCYVQICVLEMFVYFEQLQSIFQLLYHHSLSRKTKIQYFSVKESEPHSKRFPSMCAHSLCDDLAFVSECLVVIHGR